MSEQRIVVWTPDYEAAADMLHGYVHLLNNDIETPGLDAAKNIVDAALAVSGIRIVELPDVEKLREALETWAHWNPATPGMSKVGRDFDVVLAAARWVLSLER